MNTAILKNFSATQGMALLVLWGGLALPGAAQDTVWPVVASPALPAGIQPDSPVSQVLKLAQAGVDEGIIAAYVTNSPGTFNLTSDQIIFLKDAGVPGELVTAMIQHDSALQAQMAAAPPPPTSPVTPPPDDSQPSPPDTQTADTTAPPVTDVTVNNFYTDLAPYGTWLNVEGYGACWRPGVTIYNHDWQPYGDHGHWVYTQAGWYWASDYSWGWAPFHYGRWFRNSGLGWCWAPDTAWGPSWVTWRYDNEYCGWAPLPPGAYYQPDGGLVYNGNGVAAGFDFGLSPDAFVFVATGNFCDPHPFRHRLDHDLAFQAYHHATVVNSFGHDRHGFVNRGIDPARIIPFTHAPIRAVPLRNGAGVAGRFPVADPLAHAAGAKDANRPPTPPSQTYHPAGGQSSAPNRQAAPAPLQNRYTAPGSGPNRYAPAAPMGNRSLAPEPAANHSAAPSPLPRPVVPSQAYHPVTPAPEPRPEPQPRPEAPSYPVERPQHAAPAPAPVRNNPPPTAPAAPRASNPNQKQIPH